MRKNMLNPAAVCMYTSVVCAPSSPLYCRMFRFMYRISFCYFMDHACMQNYIYMYIPQLRGSYPVYVHN